MYQFTFDGFPAVVNPHEVLASANQEAFALYRAGAHLHVWRNSSPHNWWLENPAASPEDGDKTVYHWAERTRPGQAFFLFSRKVTVSEKKVSYGGWMRGGDEGSPVSEVWAYDDAVFQASVVDWDLAVACAETFNRLQGSASASPATLTAYQRQIARSLKRSRPWPMHPDIELGQAVGYGHVDVVDLCARGLAQVDPRGYLHGTELLARTTIPSERRLAAQLTS